MMNLILSPRLKRIAESIVGYESIADIGTDHAYLPIYLMKTKKIAKAIASDINDGPVKIAEHRISRYNLAQSIEVRKGNGLEVLAPEEVDAIVIAGMGGILISEILEKSIKVAESAKLLVLQPMRDSDVVRKWLLSNGFNILDEDMVKDEGKIYEIIWTAKGESNEKIKDFMLIGQQVIERKHPLALQLVIKRINELEKIVESISAVRSDNCLEKLSECEKLLDYYKEVKQCLQ